MPRYFFFIILFVSIALMNLVTWPKKKPVLHWPAKAACNVLFSCHHRFASDSQVTAVLVEGLERVQPCKHADTAASLLAFQDLNRCSRHGLLQFLYEPSARCTKESKSMSEVRWRMPRLTKSWRSSTFRWQLSCPIADPAPLATVSTSCQRGMRTLRLGKRKRSL